MNVLDELDLTPDHQRKSVQQLVQEMMMESGEVARDPDDVPFASEEGSQVKPPRAKASAATARRARGRQSATAAPSAEEPDEDEDEKGSAGSLDEEADEEEPAPAAKPAHSKSGARGRARKKAGSDDEDYKPEPRRKAASSKTRKSAAASAGPASKRPAPASRKRKAESPLLTHEEQESSTEADDGGASELEAGEPRSIRRRVTSLPDIDDSPEAPHARATSHKKIEGRKKPRQAKPAGAPVAASFLSSKAKKQAAELVRVMVEGLNRFMPLAVKKAASSIEEQRRFGHKAFHEMEALTQKQDALLTNLLNKFAEVDALQNDMKAFLQQIKNKDIAVVHTAELNAQVDKMAQSASDAIAYCTRAAMKAQRQSLMIF